MKKIITLLTILACTGFSFIAKAQLAYYTASTHITGDPSTILAATVSITDTSNHSISVRIVRTNTSLAAGNLSYFCWGLTCYAPTTSVSPALTMAAGETDTLLCDADPNGANATDMVSYLVYDVNDSANDNISFELTYDFATGIHSFNPLANNYMICSQSNDGDITYVTYNINNPSYATLVIRNLLGSLVKEIALTDKQGVLPVSTSELPAGLYMYFLYNNGQPVATKKIVVSRR